MLFLEKTARRRRRVVKNKPRAPEAIAVSEFARHKLAFEPDARQAAVLDSTAKRGMLNCTRQWGKSTVLAVKAVHRAWTVAGSLTLVASPSERQSGEFLRKAAEFLGRLGVKRRGDGDNSSSLALPNGSRIVGLPGIEGTVRGFSAVSLLLIDEASRVADATYKSLRPMLAVGNGDLWLMSTPYGKRGFFYEAWAHGDGWERHRRRLLSVRASRPSFWKRSGAKWARRGSRRNISAISSTMAEVGSAAKWWNARSATMSRYGCEESPQRSAFSYQLKGFALRPILEKRPCDFGQRVSQDGKPEVQTNSRRIRVVGHRPMLQ